ncbi:MAG: cell division FtsA domain-containing protein, partial [Pseudomonadota bacterium]
AEDVTSVPYASGMSSTLVDERKLGVTVIDLGSGTSTFAVFADDHLLHVDALAIGADQITFNLARQLETPLAQAERIKALYGTMVVAASDSNEIVAYQTLSNPGEMCGRVSRSELSAIMVPRVQWFLSELRTRMDACPVRSYAGDRIVLTGGGSQIVGLDVFAADFLKRPVRIGVPQPIEGAPAEFSHPAFSGLFGLASTILRRSSDMGGLAQVPNSGSVEPGGYLSRVGQWLVGAG